MSEIIPQHKKVTVLSFDVGIKNLSLCLFATTSPDNEVGTPFLHVLEWQVLNLQPEPENPLTSPEKTKSKTKPKMELDTLSTILYRSMDEMFEAQPHYPDVVLIENQPALKNPIMKTIQMLIYSYFHGRSYWRSLGTTIKFMSATEKLKPFEINSTDYAGRKKAAIHYVRMIFAEVSRRRQFFDSHKKKDDLADSFLQGLAWAIKSKCVSSDIRDLSSQVS